MATLNFSICLNHDCTEFEFIDQTGVQPDSPNGYGATEDLAQYTGVLEFIKSDGEIDFSAPVTPSDGSVKQVISLDDVETSEVYYGVRYTVYDSNGDVLYISSELPLAIACKFKCDLVDLQKKGLKSCKCSKKAAMAANEARQSFESSTYLANAGDLVGAETLYEFARNKIKHTKCNC